ncbi:MAG: hypothetical protein RIC91_00145 [Gammaproteobacteria bacterium]
MVAIFAISVFFAVFSVYMLKVFAKVERVAVNTTVNNINVVLTSKLVEAIVKNDYSDIETVLDQNPYLLIGGKQVADLKDESAINFSARTNVYAGAIDSDRLDNVVKGNWYYDPVKKHLIYMIKNTEMFDSTLEGPERIHFRIEIEFEDLNNNATYESHVDKLIGASLKPVTSYTWTN